MASNFLRHYMAEGEKRPPLCGNWQTRVVILMRVESRGIECYAATQVLSHI